MKRLTTATADMGRCETCGASLDDASLRFCGGDRCEKVLVKVAVSRPGHGKLLPSGPFL